MQLNQPIPPTNAGGDNPYDFILNGNQKPKKPLIPLPGGNSRKQRTLIMIGGGLGLAVVLLIIFMLIFSSGGGSTKTLLVLAQDQTEIARISGDGRDEARSASVQGYAATVAASMTTSQQQTVKFLKSKRQKTDAKNLALGRKAATDKSLDSAQAAGRYDDELVKVLNASLASYKVEVTNAYNDTKSKSERALLKQLFEQADTLTKNQPTSS